ncbi:hypothetical protein CPB83DRAFT_840513 [Crepidotus variabilis]|uniref:Uncharacterized protein n=1 Tax=Crepidotus variabilis TaxID=179855 RepID=A0A9P6JIJ8_9AGAR|nr:hypothetical protein CPB83DRAFT_840513 [Crepidotus variabilis]
MYGVEKCEGSERVTSFERASPYPMRGVHKYRVGVASWFVLGLVLMELYLDKRKESHLIFDTPASAHAVPLALPQPAAHTVHLFARTGNTQLPTHDFFSIPEIVPTPTEHSVLLHPSSDVSKGIPEISEGNLPGITLQLRVNESLSGNEPVLEPEFYLGVHGIFRQRLINNLEAKAKVKEYRAKLKQTFQVFSILAELRMQSKLQMEETEQKRSEEKKKSSYAQAGVNLSVPKNHLVREIEATKPQPEFGSFVDEQFDQQRAEMEMVKAYVQTMEME